jgi:hypothetical protein
MAGAFRDNEKGELATRQQSRAPDNSLNAGGHPFPGGAFEPKGAAFESNDLNLFDFQNRLSANA